MLKSRRWTRRRRQRVMRRRRKRMPTYLQRAQRFAEELKERVWAFRWHELDFATFRREQAATWNRVRADRDPRVLLAVNRIMTPWSHAR